MRRFIAAAAVGLAAMAVYATVAPAGQQAVTPRQFKALSKKVTTLQKKLTSVNNELGAFENCFTAAVPIGRFGDDANQTEGYIYHGSDGTDFLTTALDVTDAAHAEAFVLVTNAQCAAIFNGGRKSPLSLGGAHK